jgi:hypothetical protein
VDVVGKYKRGQCPTQVPTGGNSTLALTTVVTMIKITSTFKLVFGTVVGFTLISGITAVGIASQPQLTPQQDRVFETCQTTWQTGIGAVVGLMGGKAADLLHKEEEDEDKDKQ